MKRWRKSSTASKHNADPVPWMSGHQFQLTGQHIILHSNHLSTDIEHLSSIWINQPCCSLTGIQTPFCLAAKHPVLGQHASWTLLLFGSLSLSLPSWTLYSEPKPSCCIGKSMICSFCMAGENKICIDTRNCLENGCCLALGCSVCLLVIMRGDILSVPC